MMNLLDTGLERKNTIIFVLDFGAFEMKTEKEEVCHLNKLMMVNVEDGKH